jgi:hypothetical protein
MTSVRRNLGPHGFNPEHCPSFMDGCNCTPENLNAVFDLVRQQQREECCAAICRRCAEGAPIVGYANGKPMHEYSCGKPGCTRHHGTHQECCAHAIHALAAQPLLLTHPEAPVGEETTP